MKLYRTVALSDNMVVNYITNTMTFAYRSIMGKNVRHIMSKWILSLNKVIIMMVYDVIKATRKRCV